MDWVQIKSWHIVKSYTRVINGAITLCGRSANGRTSTDIGNEKSCESCLRIYKKTQSLVS